MFAELPLLSLLVWLPIAGGVWVLTQAKGSADTPTVRPIALTIATLTFLLSLPLYFQFDVTTAAMQFEEKLVWIQALNTYYHLGVDGISVPLILLTTFTTVLVILSAWDVIQTRPAQYMAAFLIMEGLMNGVFAALDAMLFYVFWEAMLVPMFIIIGVWGGPNRIYAAVKFFLYTFLGSVLMLVAFLYMYVQAGGQFGILDFHQLNLSPTAQTLIFFAFLAAFAVKVPMWPVHTWLPDAHVEAPTGGSVVLAAIMLKMGTYGFLRFSLPITPQASQELAWFIILLSLVAIVYIGFVALVQQDMKKLIAYSSISHMGFVTLGFFTMFAILQNTQSVDAAAMGIEGGIIQMISHGFISGALFLCVGVLYDRLHSREISSYGGVANTMPRFALFAVLFAMANSGLPGTSGFVGEFMVILSSFQANFWIAFFAATTLILGAAYTLWMVKRVIYGSIPEDKIETVGRLTDINARETFILTILAIAVLFFGIWPAPLQELMHVSVTHLIEHVINAK